MCYTEAVSFAAINHVLEVGALVVVLCWIFATGAGVDACASFPEIHGCIVSVSGGFP